MNTGTKKVLFWTPRILCFAFAAFLSLFALDVFGEGGGLWSTVFALLIHLIPTFFVLFVLIMAWRWEWIGAIVFSALAVLYVVLFWGRFPMAAYFSISGPLVLIGILFLFNWLYRAELRTS